MRLPGANKRYNRNRDLFADLFDIIKNNKKVNIKEHF